MIPILGVTGANMDRVNQENNAGVLTWATTGTSLLVSCWPSGSPAQPVQEAINAPESDAWTYARLKMGVQYTVYLFPSHPILCMLLVVTCSVRRARLQ